MGGNAEGNKGKGEAGRWKAKGQTEGGTVGRGKGNKTAKDTSAEHEKKTHWQQPTSPEEKEWEEWED